VRWLRQRGPGRKLAPVFRNPGGPCRPRPAPKTTLSPSRPPASRRPERRPSASAPGRAGGGGSWGPGGPDPGAPRGLGARGPRARGPRGASPHLPAPARCGGCELPVCGRGAGRVVCPWARGRWSTMPGGGKLRAVGAVRAFPGSQSRIHCCCFHLSQHRRQKLSVCRSAAGSLPGCGRGADEQMRPPKNEATGRQEMRGEHPRDPHLAQRPRHLVAPPWPSRCALGQNRSSGAERGRRVQAGGFVGSRRHAAPPGRGLRAQSRAGWP